MKNITEMIFFLSIELLISCVLLANTDILCHLGTNHQHCHSPVYTETHKHTCMHTCSHTFYCRLVLTIKFCSLNSQLFVSPCYFYEAQTFLIQTSVSVTCFLSFRIPPPAQQCLCFLCLCFKGRNRN